MPGTRCFYRFERLEWFGAFLRAELTVDAGAGESAHVVFRFSRGHERSLARELELLPVAEGDVSSPRPSVSILVLTEHGDKGLVPV
jgi:hypothetical protein